MLHAESFKSHTQFCQNQFHEMKRWPDPKDKQQAKRHQPQQSQLQHQTHRVVQLAGTKKPSWQWMEAEEEPRVVAPVKSPPLESGAPFMSHPTARSAFPNRKQSKVSSWFQLNDVRLGLRVSRSKKFKSKSSLDGSESSIVTYDQNSHKSGEKYIQASKKVTFAEDSKLNNSDIGKSHRTSIASSARTATPHAACSRAGKRKNRKTLRERKRSSSLSRSVSQSRVLAQRDESPHEIDTLTTNKVKAKCSTDRIRVQEGKHAPKYKTKSILQKEAISKLYKERLLNKNLKVGQRSGGAEDHEHQDSNDFVKTGFIPFADSLCSHSHSDDDKHLSAQTNSSKHASRGLAQKVVDHRSESEDIQFPGTSSSTGRFKSLSHPSAFQRSHKKFKQGHTRLEDPESQLDGLLTIHKLNLTNGTAERPHSVLNSSRDVRNQRNRRSESAIAWTRSKVAVDTQRDKSFLSPKQIMENRSASPMAVMGDGNFFKVKVRFTDTNHEPHSVPSDTHIRTLYDENYYGSGYCPMEKTVWVPSNSPNPESLSDADTNSLLNSRKYLDSISSQDLTIGGGMSNSSEYFNNGINNTADCISSERLENQIEYFEPKPTHHEEITKSAFRNTEDTSLGEVDAESHSSSDISLPLPVKPVKIKDLETKQGSRYNSALKPKKGDRSRAARKGRMTRFSGSTGSESEESSLSNPDNSSTFVVSSCSMTETDGEGVESCFGPEQRRQAGSEENVEVDIYWQDSEDSFHSGKPVSDNEDQLDSIIDVEDNIRTILAKYKDHRDAIVSSEVQSIMAKYGYPAVAKAKIQSQVNPKTKNADNYFEGYKNNRLPDDSNNDLAFSRNHTSNCSSGDSEPKQSNSEMAESSNECPIADGQGLKPGNAIHKNNTDAQSVGGSEGFDLSETKMDTTVSDSDYLKINFDSLKYTDAGKTENSGESLSSSDKNSLFGSNATASVAETCKDVSDKSNDDEPKPKPTQNRKKVGPGAGGSKCEVSSAWATSNIDNSGVIKVRSVERETGLVASTTSRNTLDVSLSPCSSVLELSLGDDSKLADLHVSNLTDDEDEKSEYVNNVIHTITEANQFNVPYMNGDITGRSSSAHVIGPARRFRPFPFEKEGSLTDPTILHGGRAVKSPDLSQSDIRPARLESAGSLDLRSQSKYTTNQVSSSKSVDSFTAGRDMGRFSNSRQSLASIIGNDQRNYIQSSRTLACILRDVKRLSKRSKSTSSSTSCSKSSRRRKGKKKKKKLKKKPPKGRRVYWNVNINKRKKYGRNRSSNKKQKKEAKKQIKEEIQEPDVIPREEEVFSPIYWPMATSYANPMDYSNWEARVNVDLRAFIDTNQDVRIPSLLAMAATDKKQRNGKKGKGKNKKDKKKKTGKDNSSKTSKSSDNVKDSSSSTGKTVKAPKLKVWFRDWSTSDDCSNNKEQDERGNFEDAVIIDWGPDMNLSNARRRKGAKMSMKKKSNKRQKQGQSKGAGNVPEDVMVFSKTRLAHEIEKKRQETGFFSHRNSSLYRLFSGSDLKQTVSSPRSASKQTTPRRIKTAGRLGSYGGSKDGGVDAKPSFLLAASRLHLEAKDVPKKRPKSAPNLRGPESKTFRTSKSPPPRLNQERISSTTINTAAGEPKREREDQTSEPLYYSNKGPPCFDFLIGSVDDDALILGQEESGGPGSDFGREEIQILWKLIKEPDGECAVDMKEDERKKKYGKKDIDLKSIMAKQRLISCIKWVMSKQDKIIGDIDRAVDMLETEMADQLEQVELEWPKARCLMEVEYPIDGDFESDVVVDWPFPEKGLIFKTDESELQTDLGWPVAKALPSVPRKPKTNQSQNKHEGTMLTKNAITPHPPLVPKQKQTSKRPGFTMNMTEDTDSNSLNSSVPYPRQEIFEDKKITLAYLMSTQEKPTKINMDKCTENKKAKDSSARTETGNRSNAQITDITSSNSDNRGKGVYEVNGRKPDKTTSWMNPDTTGTTHRPRLPRQSLRHKCGRIRRKIKQTLQSIQEVSEESLVSHSDRVKAQETEVASEKKASSTSHNALSQDHPTGQEETQPGSLNAKPVNEGTCGKTSKSNTNTAGTSMTGPHCFDKVPALDIRQRLDKAVKMRTGDQTEAGDVGQSAVSQTFGYVPSGLRQKLSDQDVDSPKVSSNQVCESSFVHASKMYPPTPVLHGNYSYGRLAGYGSDLSSEDFQNSEFIQPGNHKFLWTEIYESGSMAESWMSSQRQHISSDTSNMSPSLDTYNKINQLGKSHESQPGTTHLGKDVPGTKGVVSAADGQWKSTGDFSQIRKSGYTFPQASQYKATARQCNLDSFSFTTSEDLSNGDFPQKRGRGAGGTKFSERDFTPWIIDEMDNQSGESKFIEKYQPSVATVLTQRDGKGRNRVETTSQPELMETSTTARNVFATVQEHSKGYQQSHAVCDNLGTNDTKNTTTVTSEKYTRSLTDDETVPFAPQEQSMEWQQSQGITSTSQRRDSDSKFNRSKGKSPIPNPKTGKTLTTHRPGSQMSVSTSEHRANECSNSGKQNYDTKRIGEKFKSLSNIKQQKGKKRPCKKSSSFSASDRKDTQKGAGAKTSTSFTSVSQKASQDQGNTDSPVADIQVKSSKTPLSCSSNTRSQKTWSSAVSTVEHYATSSSEGKKDESLQICCQPPMPCFVFGENDKSLHSDRTIKVPSAEPTDTGQKHNKNTSCKPRNARAIAHSNRGYSKEPISREQVACTTIPIVFDPFAKYGSKRGLFKLGKNKFMNQRGKCAEVKGSTTRAEVPSPSKGSITDRFPYHRDQMPYFRYQEPDDCKTAYSSHLVYTDNPPRCPTPPQLRQDPERLNIIETPQDHRNGPNPGGEVGCKLLCAALSTYNGVPSDDSDDDKSDCSVQLPDESPSPWPLRRLTFLNRLLAFDNSNQS